MKELMIKEYPTLLEKTSFLPKTSYPSLDSILTVFCHDDSIVIQLSMESELVGTQTLLLLNSAFRTSKEMDGLVGYSMMHINEKKIEIKEVGKELFSSS